MTRDELRNLQAGDKVRALAFEKDANVKSLHTISGVAVKDFDTYTHCTMHFADGISSFCCTHCNGTMWRKE